jgi:type IV secretory pathway VirB2 component (pilin)
MRFYIQVFTNSKEEEYVSRKKSIIIALAVVGLCIVATDVFASTGTGMPWESRLDGLLNSLQGPVARVLGAFAIIGLGIGLSFSEGGSMMKKGLWVVFGLTLAFNATTWALPWLGFGGGLLL